MGCSGSGERTVTEKRAPGSGAEVIEVGGGHVVFLGAGSPLSRALNLGLHGPVVGDDLGRMERFFRDRGGTTQIEVASLADPSLLAALSARGYLIAEQTHSLVCSLKAKPLREQPTHRSASTGHVEIIRVGPDELEHWVDVVLRCSSKNRRALLRRCAREQSPWEWCPAPRLGWPRGRSARRWRLADDP